MLQIGSVIFVCIAVGALQATLGFELYDDSIPKLGTPRLFGTPCRNRGQPFRPTKFQRKHTARPARFNFKKPSAKDIINFVCTFQGEVKSSEILTDFFEYFEDLPAMEFSNGKYPEILDNLIQIKTPNPEFVAYEAIEALAENYAKLSSDTVIEVYSNSIAKYLITEGVLTSQNSVKLAKQFAKAMEEAANCNDSPYKALNEGCLGFLDSLELFTPNTALLITLIYENEWKTAVTPKRR